MRKNLGASGVRLIVDIPPSVRLTTGQEIVRRAVTTGEPFVSNGLQDALDSIVPPAHFIDFETMNPALPVYPGTRPYQMQPFPWSDHVRASDGSIEHFEFLGDDRADPRRGFAETLLDRLAGAATVVVHNGSFEQSRLRELQSVYPDLGESLQAVLDLPWVDLLKVIRDNFYDREFHGSYSIKSVLPALVPKVWLRGS